MAKLILMSVVLMLPIICAISARDPDPRRGLKKAVWAFALFNVVYVVLVVLVYPLVVKLPAPK